MKKFMKLVPVALAAFAFASCSDDLGNQANNAGEFENALYFTMENTSDGTRAGMIGDASDNLSALKFRWTKDDCIRVYDANLAMYDVYKYGGESFVENTPASAFTNPAPFEEKKLTGYTIGVYPNDEVEAVYLDKQDRGKKHIVMNLPQEYTYEAATGTKEGYRCDVPMYGNISDVTTGVTEMNFLTAWTRIYMRNIPTDIKYICVVSENDDQPLAGQFEAQVHYPLATTDEPWLKKIEATDVSSTWHNILWAELPTITEVAEKEGICFPLLVQKYDKIHIYGVKTSAGLDAAGLETLDNNMSDVDGWQKLLNDGKAIEIDSKTDLNITRRRQCWTVRYTYTYYLDTDPVDPFRPGEVSKVLADNADNIIGAFRIVPYHGAAGLTPVDPTLAKVLTSGPGDHYTHRIEIPQISDLANIILDFSGAGIQYDEALQVYDKNPETKKFAGKLTIIPGKIVGGDAKIEINLPEAEVWIVGNGVNPIGNVDVQNAKKVHIGDGVTATTQQVGKTTIFKGGILYIEDKAEIANVYAQAYLGDPTQHAQELIVNPGGQISATAYIQTDCNVTLNGAGYDAVADKEYKGVQNDGLASIITLDCEAVPTSCTITSQGDSRIGVLKAPTEGVKLNKLTINTKMFQKSATDKAPTQGRTLGLFDGKVAVFTGSQLTKLAESGVTAQTLLVADEIDMNNVEWTGGGIAANVYSINYNVTGKRMNKLTDADEKKASTATGLTEIKNLKLKNKVQNGLFSEMTTVATIAGLTFNTVTFAEDMTSNTDMKIAALLGEASKAATIDEVTVTGLSFSSKGASVMGGLIGTAAADVTINDASVSGSITGRSFIGGMIGQTKENIANINIYDSKTPTLSLGLGLINDLTSLQSSLAGTFGSFIGGAKVASIIAIFDCNYGTALTKAAKGNGESQLGLRFAAIADASDAPFFGGNPWIGRFTTEMGKLVSVVSTAANKKTFTSFTYGEKQMELQKWQGAASAYNMTDDSKKVANTASVHTNNILYDGSDATVANPNQGYRYGFNIYGPYTDADFGYDNAYKDAKVAE